MQSRQLTRAQGDLCSGQSAFWQSLPQYALRLQREHLSSLAPCSGSRPQPSHVLLPTTGAAAAAAHAAAASEAEADDEAPAAPRLLLALAMADFGKRCRRWCSYLTSYVFERSTCVVCPRLQAGPVTFTRKLVAHRDHYSLGRVLCDECHHLLLWRGKLFV